MLTKQQAVRLIDSYLSDVQKTKHVFAVAAVMKDIAKKIGMNERQWELVGLLHDLDYDIVRSDMRSART